MKNITKKIAKIRIINYIVMIAVIAITLIPTTIYSLDYTWWLWPIFVFEMLFITIAVERVDGKIKTLDDLISNSYKPIGITINRHKISIADQTEGYIITVVFHMRFFNKIRYVQKYNDPFGRSFKYLDDYTERNSIKIKSDELVSVSNIILTSNASEAHTFESKSECDAVSRQIINMFPMDVLSEKQSTVLPYSEDYYF